MSGDFQAVTRIQPRREPETRLRAVMSPSVTGSDVLKAVGFSNVEVVGGIVVENMSAHLMTDNEDAARSSGAQATEWRPFCDNFEEAGRSGLETGLDLVCFVG